MLCHHHYFFIFADSSPSHPSVTALSLPPAMSEDNDDFSDFQGPVDTPTSFPLPPSSSSSSSTTTPSSFGFSSQAQPSSSAPNIGFSEDDDEFSDFVQGPVNTFPSANFHLSSQSQVESTFPPSQSLPSSVSIHTDTQHSAVSTSTQSAFQGNSSLALFTPPPPIPLICPFFHLVWRNFLH